MNIIRGQTFQTFSIKKKKNNWRDYLGKNPTQLFDLNPSKLSELEH